MACTLPFPLGRPIVRRYRTLLARYLSPHWGKMIVLIFLLLGSISLELAGPQIVRFFLDTAVAQGSLFTLIAIAIAFLVVALLIQGMSIAESYVAGLVSWSATNQLRTDLTLHCLQLDQSFHQTHTPGELIERIDGDVNRLATFFSSLLLKFLGSLVLLLGIIVLCFQIEWRVGLGILALTAIAFVVLFTLRHVGIQQWEKERQASADLFGFLEERLSGTEDLRAAGAVPHTLRQLALKTRALLRATVRAVIAGSLVFSFILILDIGTAGALGLGVYLYLNHTITLGSVYLIFSYTELLRRPIQELSRQVQEVQQATASIVRIQELLETRSRLTDGNSPKLLIGPVAVAFQNVDFAYNDGDELALKDITFSIPVGGTLGVLGRTGSGKTTLSRLLFRLYDPTRGAILLGGVDLRELRIADARSRIGLVPQNVQLFHATVRDNLTFFDRSINDSQIMPILEELGLGQWYHTLPEGLDTTLAPDGSGLSAGEAQLLAFARVFLQNPGVVILDEASSRLDLATERMLERAIDRLLMERTAIIIAHRLATLQRVDAILLLEDGRMREYGTREQLTRNPESQFAHLLRVGLEETLV